MVVAISSSDERVCRVSHSIVEFNDVGLTWGDERVGQGLNERQVDGMGGCTRRMEQGTVDLFECAVLDDGGCSVVRRSDVGEEEEKEEEENAMEIEQMVLMGLPLQFGGTGEQHGGGRNKARKESTGLHTIGAHSSATHIRFDNMLDIDVDVDAAASHVEKQNKKNKNKKKKGRRRQVPCLDPDGVQTGSILHKYWLQRYSLFSLFDQGIMMDEEGWYSATPEIIAWHHASMIAKAVGPGCVVLDAFGGVGGNAIQLALAGCQVIVTELCPQRAMMIQNNARVYGVEDSVEVVCGDVLTCGPHLLGIDVVLLSPPWGGPEYTQEATFDVQTMGGNTELSFNILLDLVSRRMGARSALFWLPRNSDLEQIGLQVLKTLPTTHHECHIELSKINGRPKGITVYVGTLGDFVSKFNKR